MAPGAPSIPEVHARASWRIVDFISDLHLGEDENESAPAGNSTSTLSVWQHYLETTPADAVFILGDLFEVWIGDDAVLHDGTLERKTFEGRCAEVLGRAAERLALYFMHGNRDFLVGSELMDACNVTLLADPTVLVFPQGGEQRWLLSHGDALCLDDHEYLEFRKQVRGADWQHAFLGQSLAQRREIAMNMRRQSQARKEAGTVYADVDAAAARQWLRLASAHTLIHGHTHRPARHELGEGLSRVVLSDWHTAGPQPRAEVLRLGSGALTRIPLL